MKLNQMKFLVLAAVATLTVTACSKNENDSNLSDDHDIEEPIEEAVVYCRNSNNQTELVRLSDDRVIGNTMTEEQCAAAVAGAVAGIACTKDLYQGRSGFAPTAIRYPRATGHSGTRDIETCNRMISNSNKLVMCSYSGSSLGWKTTRTYNLPGEPARYPHRFGASSPSLDECLAITAGSLVIWQEDRLIHQTCRWGGSDWYPTCGSDSNVSMGGRGGSVEQCLASIQTPQPGCSTPITEELELLRGLTNR